MSEGGKLSAEQMRAFLEGSEEHRFRGKRRAEVYEWITRTLRAQEYRKQGKKMRGLLKRYVEKMTGRSRTQVTLRVARYLEHSEVKVSIYRRHRFASRFTRADVELLAQVDEAHETLSGPATHLRPVLQDLLERFPFPIRGFHSDNGSEFINDTVSGLLRDLLIVQTKSRARKSNDNGLVESKNGAVIRKHMGYGYIATEHAEDIHAFYQSAFNPYLNFHRPCGQPDRIVDPRGKQTFVYKRYATPWETLRTLERASPPGQSYLKPAVSLQCLDQIANAHSDTESARRMQEAKRKLFLGFRQERKTA